MAGIITRRDHTIEWRDFVSITGIYGSALPEPEEGPDSTNPTDPADWDLVPSPHNLPMLLFEADQYLTEVERATRDRSWETRPRAVIRHLKAMDPTITLFAAHEGENVTVWHRVDKSLHNTDLRVPQGDPNRLAQKLLSLLRSGLDPATIAHRDLWK